MDFKIAVLAGDGIGPEISVQGVDVMNAVCEKFGHKVSYEYAICGADAIELTIELLSPTCSSSRDNLSYNAVIFPGSNRFSLIANSLPAAGPFAVRPLSRRPRTLLRPHSASSAVFCHAVCPQRFH